jgi:hypothetical protein
MAVLVERTFSCLVLETVAAQFIVRLRPAGGDGSQFVIFGVHILIGRTVRRCGGADFVVRAFRARSTGAAAAPTATLALGFCVRCRATLLMRFARDGFVVRKLLGEFLRGKQLILIFRPACAFCFWRTVTARSVVSRATTASPAPTPAARTPLVVHGRTGLVGYRFVRFRVFGLNDLDLVES